MDVLVLGGTHHVGRSVVEVALARGHSVTTLARGLSGPPAAGARELHADRTDVASVKTALGSLRWDAVIDTWSGAPRAVRDSAAMLADRVGQYCYVSSRSVYRWPIRADLDESGPVVDGDPSSPDSAEYAAAKRGGELAAVAAFGERALLARAGLILGPLRAGGGECRGGFGAWSAWRHRASVPGPRTRPLQYIDGRDLAEWLLTAAEEAVGGAVNTVSEPGHTYNGRAARSRFDSDEALHAELLWISPPVIATAGITPWTELPIWAPPTENWRDCTTAT